MASKRKLDLPQRTDRRKEQSAKCRAMAETASPRFTLSPFRCALSNSFSLCPLWFILPFIHHDPANRIAADDIVHHIHAANHAAKDSIAAVEVRLRRMRHKPLRAAGVFAGQGHP